LVSKTTSNNEISLEEIIKKAYTRFFFYVAQATDTIKAHELALLSHRIISKYFHNLKNFELDKNGQIKVRDEISVKEILAFSVWMQQFIKELRKFVIGLGKIDVKKITAGLEKELQSLNFYEFFEQAAELSY